MYAYFLLCEKSNIKKKHYYKKALVLMMIVSIAFGILISFTGDSSGKYLAQYEPLKLAAAEGLSSTQTHAPLQVGGVFVNNVLKSSINIPGLLSYLASGSLNGVVRGSMHSILIYGRHCGYTTCSILWL
jgi:cytochrome d ubiquinol oxidase subunit I